MAGRPSRRFGHILIVDLWLALTALAGTLCYQWRYARIVDDQVSDAHRQLTATARYSSRWKMKPVWCK